MANTTVARWDVNPAKTSIKDLRKELKLLKDEMANLEEGSDAFLEVANKAGTIKHQLDEINESVKGASADFGDIMSNTLGVAAGITGAFQAAEGALRLFGVESEAVTEAIARLQGMMAMTQGIQAIDDGIKAFDKLTKSIKTTTAAGKVFKTVMQPKVLLLITGIITGLVLAFKNWEQEIRDIFPIFDKILTLMGRKAPRIKEAEEAQKKFNDRVREEHELHLAEEERISREAERIKQQRRDEKLNDDGLKRKKKLEEDIIVLQDEYNKAFHLMQDNLTNPQQYEWYKKLALSFSNSIKKSKKELDEIYDNPKYQKSLTPNPTPKKPKSSGGGGDDESAELAKRTEKYNELNLAKEISIEQNKRYAEGWKEAHAEEAKTLTEEEIAQKIKVGQLQEQIRLEKERLDLMTDYQDVVGDMAIEQQKTNIYNLENNLAELLKPKKEEVEEVVEDVVEVVEEELSKKEYGMRIFNSLKSTLEEFGESSLGITDGWTSSLSHFESVFSQTMDLVENKGKNAWNAYANVAGNAFLGIGGMLNALSEEQDKATEEGFEQMKKLQIAATTMTMLAGIMNVITSAFSEKNTWMTIWGQAAVAIAGAAAVATTGALQISKIKSTTMDNAIASGAIQPSFGAIQGTIIAPTEYSSAVQGAQTEGAINNQKVYVTESDIEGTINKVRVQEWENTY